MHSNAQREWGEQMISPDDIALHVNAENLI